MLLGRAPLLCKRRPLLVWDFMLAVVNIRDCIEYFVYQVVCFPARGEWEIFNGNIFWKVCNIPGRYAFKNGWDFWPVNICKAYPAFTFLLWFVQQGIFHRFDL